MAALKVMVMLIAAAFLMGCTNLAMATYSQSAPGSNLVSGEVWCQDCSKPYYTFAQGDKPLKGVKVCLTCLDERGRVMYYKSDLTDEEGHYEMELEKYFNGKELKAKLCSVRLLSSPDPTCNVMTDFAGGNSGVKLLRATEVFGDTIKYKLGRFFFTTPMCEKPDTSASYDESHGNKYQGNNY